MTPDVYIGLGLVLLALICWSIYRKDRDERRRLYLLEVDAEALRREYLRAQLYQAALLDRRD